MGCHNGAKAKTEHGHERGSQGSGVNENNILRIGFRARSRSKNSPKSTKNQPPFVPPPSARS